MPWTLQNGRLFYTGPGDVPLLTAAEQRTERARLQGAQAPFDNAALSAPVTPGNAEPRFIPIERFPNGSEQGYIVVDGIPVFGGRPNPSAPFRPAGNALTPGLREDIRAKFASGGEEGGGGGGRGARPLTLPPPAPPQPIPGFGGGGGGGRLGFFGPQNQTLDWLLSMLAMPGSFGGLRGGKGGGGAIPLPGLLGWNFGNNFFTPPGGPTPMPLPVASRLPGGPGPQDLPQGTPAMNPFGPPRARSDWGPGDWGFSKK